MSHIGSLRLVSACLLMGFSVLSGQVTRAQNESGIRAGGTEGNLPQFDVASIELANPNGGIVGVFTYPGGKVVVRSYTVRMLVHEAFDIDAHYILNGPMWLDDNRYDITALPAPSSKSSQLNPSFPKTPPNHELREMLQKLLMDRFQLKFHRVEKEGRVYFLTTSRKKTSLQESSDPNELPWVGSVSGGAINGDGLAGKNISMPLLAARLGRYLQCPVLDQTGLKGSFNFKVEYASGDAQPDVISSILTSVQDLGLKLLTGKGPVEALVIDSVEKPSAN